MKILYTSNTNQPIIVDDEDYIRLSKFKWCESTRGHITRSYSSESSTGKRRTIHVSIANEILKISGLIDHRDRNGFNNLKSNFRQSTNSQNQMNQTKQRGTISKYKGVTWNKVNRKWQAQIGLNKRRIYLGSYISELEAATAYNIAARILFKEFAVLNMDEHGVVLDSNVQITNLNKYIK